MRAYPIAMLLPLALLAACDKNGGTAISINASDSDGNTSFELGNGGDVAINAPGFNGAFHLPKMTLDASNIDIDGVHLYPGSKVTGMNVDANDTPGASKGSAQIHFTSPATPDQVRGYFADRLGKAGYTLHADGQGLAGTAKDGKPFRLELAPNGAAGASGTIVASSS